MKERFPMSERSVIVFDVNETLLDLDAIADQLMERYPATSGLR
jgi:hypothetical protein